MKQIISPWNLYDRDYLQWIDDTVNKLQIGDFANLDMDNLIEEIEDLGRSQKRELNSRLKMLLEHLLKRIYVNMPQEFNGWERTIREQRSQIELELNSCPSLRSQWHDSFDSAWNVALKYIRRDYQHKGFDFPDTWQFSRDINAILDIDFWM